VSRAEEDLGKQIRTTAIPECNRQDIETVPCDFAALRNKSVGAQPTSIIELIGPRSWLPARVYS
jgi:hypothetical protein